MILLGVCCRTAPQPRFCAKSRQLRCLHDMVRKVCPVVEQAMETEHESQRKLRVGASGPGSPNEMSKTLIGATTRTGMSSWFLRGCSNEN